MLQPGAKQGPSPSSGLNAHVKLVDSSVLALHLVWHEKKPSSGSLGEKKENPPKEGDPHQGQEAWKKEIVNSAG